MKKQPQYILLRLGQIGLLLMVLAVFSNLVVRNSFMLEKPTISCNDTAEETIEEESGMEVLDQWYENLSNINSCFHNPTPQLVGYVFGANCMHIKHVPAPPPKRS